MAVHRRFIFEPEDQIEGCRLRLEIEDWRGHPDDDSARIEITMTDPGRDAEQEVKTMWVTLEELAELRASIDAAPIRGVVV
jgi:hypothetical protein